MAERKISNEELGKRISEGRKKAFAERKKFQEAFDIILRRRMSGVADDGEPKTMLDSICEAVINKVLTTGDVKGFECIRDTVGEKPTERVDTTHTVIMEAVEIDGKELKLNIGEEVK